MTFLLKYINLILIIFLIFLFYRRKVVFIEISKNLKALSKYFPENLYVVGGYVRNKLLPLPAGDVDLTSSVTIDEVQKRLENSGFSVKVKNAKLGSILISKDNENFEYTTFRKEFYKDDGSHCPCQIEFTQSIEEDAIRRDFSVNSIYFNINKDEIVDIYHGVIDAKEKIIRCNIDPNEILKHDGERILRMVRFAGELNFKIDKNTFNSAIKHAKNIKDLQGYRKYGELEKILYCDMRYQNKNGFKRALKLLNKLGVWQYFGINKKVIKFDMVFKTQDRFLGFMIDIIDAVEPECLETFCIDFFKTQCDFSCCDAKKIFGYLAGYYNALNGMKNKEYFFKHYSDWAYIFPLLGAKSKHLQNRYNFFYQYIIKHGLTICLDDLKIGECDIKTNFPNIDKRNYNRILNNLLSKVFDGKVVNNKEDLLNEIEKNLQNY